MMGKKNKQLCMVMLDIEDLIPQGHLVRKVNELGSVKISDCCQTK